MTTPAIGERAITRYIKHPAASTSNPLSNGWAIDAGTAQLFDSNLSVLAYESVRPLVQSRGPGLITTQTSGNKFWDGFDDGTEAPSRTFTGSYLDIPWGDRWSSVRFGPFALYADRYRQDAGVDTSRIGLRDISFAIGCTTVAANTVQNVFVTLTNSEDGPQINDGNTIGAAATVSLSGTGQTFARGTIDLGNVDPETLTTIEWPSRPASAAGARMVRIVRAYVWVGWYFTNPGAVSNYVDTISAWEIR
jgi:hypothetical protein